MSDLLTRGVAKVIPKDLADQKLKSGKKLRLYWGIDPTGARIHVGHAVPLRTMQRFVEAGHDVIFLVGSFTAMIGDPTGKDTMREPLTRDQVELNFQTYKQQASKILDFSKVKIRYNHEWLEKLKFDEIIKIASNFTVQQMLEREMFQLRMNVKVECPSCHAKVKYWHNPIGGIPAKHIQHHLDNWNSYVNEIVTNEHIYAHDLKQKNRGQICDNCKKEIHYRDLKTYDFSPPSPISVHEFFYPLMVGYDSVMLDVDVELGGTDQEFNMLAGRTLQKAFGKREKFVMTTKLLEGTDGRKMSKSYDNCIYLDDAPNDMFGKVMSVKDDLMEQYFELCTDVDMAEAKALLKGNPRDAKVRLAKEIVALYHGSTAADMAVYNFEKVFTEGAVPDDIPETTAKKGESLLDVLAREKMIASKSDGRRLIDQGAVTLDGAQVTEIHAPADKGVVKVGRRKFLRIK